MNIQNPFRLELGGVSGWINEALDLILAKINGIWSVEHNPDGTHGDVTVESATVETLSATTSTLTTATVTTLRLPNGSASAPPLAFTTATTTGLYHEIVVATPKIHVAIRGTSAVEITHQGGNNAGLLTVPDAASGTGTGAIGAAILIGRNPGGSGSPGTLSLTDRSGAQHVTWFDASGFLRVHTGIPNESSGDLIGAPIPLALKDGVTAPSTVSGIAQIYVDSADGDLKVKFSDGVVKTIVVDT